MTKAAQQILKGALSLSERERATVANSLLESAPPPGDHKLSHQMSGRDRAPRSRRVGWRARRCLGRVPLMHQSYRFRPQIALAIASLTLCLAPPAVAEEPPTTLIHAGNLLAVPGEAPEARQTVLIRGDRIDAIEDGFLDPTTVEGR